MLMSAIQKISIALTGEQVASLGAVVEAGEYATTSEIMREALRDWQWKRELRSEDLKHLRQLWAEGKESGPATSLDLAEVRQEARKHLKAAQQAVHES